MFERSKLHPIFVPVHKKLPSQANLPTLPSRINPQLCCLLLWRANIVAGTQPVHCPWGLPHMKSAKLSEFWTPPPHTAYINQLILFLFSAFWGPPPPPTNCGRHIWKPLASSREGQKNISGIFPPSSLVPLMLL